MPLFLSATHKQISVRLQVGKLVSPLHSHTICGSTHTISRQPICSLGATQLTGPADKRQHVIFGASAVYFATKSATL